MSTKNLKAQKKTVELLSTEASASCAFVDVAWISSCRRCINESARCAKSSVTQYSSGNDPSWCCRGSPMVARSIHQALCVCEVVSTECETELKAAQCWFVPINLASVVSDLGNCWHLTGGTTLVSVPRHSSLNNWFTLSFQLKIARKKREIDKLQTVVFDNFQQMWGSFASFSWMEMASVGSGPLCCCCCLLLDVFVTWNAGRNLQPDPKLLSAHWRCVQNTKCQLPGRYLSKKNSCRTGL